MKTVIYLFTNEQNNALSAHNVQQGMKEQKLDEQHIRLNENGNI